MKKCLSAALLLFWITGTISGQSRIIIEKLEKEKQRLIRQELTIDDSLQVLKLNDIRERLHEMGWPSSDPDLISHPGFVLAYDEEHEQAKWVAHIILKDIQSGSEGRTNKFMVDPLIKTGSAVDEDYFTKTPKPEGGYSYKGYGFDRGHLAPSADFKWSRSALAASYYYSNMSPQRPALNRGKWARLEGFLRDSVQQHNAQRMRFCETTLQHATDTPSGIRAHDVPAFDAHTQRTSRRCTSRRRTDADGGRFVSLAHRAQADEVE